MNQETETAEDRHAERPEAEAETHAAEPGNPTDHEPAEDGVRTSMGLVTDREEWRPLLAMLARHGIEKYHVIILQQHLTRPELRGFSRTNVIEVEIRHPQTWEMDAAGREALEAEMRQAAGEWAGNGFRVAWCRPVPMEWLNASFGARDRIWRDYGRGRIDRDAFIAAQDAFRDLHDKVWRQGLDHEPFLPRLAEIEEEAKRHPVPQKDLPPLDPGAVGADEVMALFRKVAAGGLKVAVQPEGSHWNAVHHTVGTFQVDGWTIEAFRRSSGMKYVQRATAPDGRTSSYDDFDRREGEPYGMLENDEQDALDMVLDAS